MDLSVPVKLLRFFEKYSSFIICGHMEPDGDCIGSQLALKSLLISMGKKADVISSGPFNRPEIEEYRELFQSQVPVKAGNTDSAVIITDCSTIERTGPLHTELAAYPIAVIDHHSTGKTLGSVVWTVPQAPSTTVLIYSLYKAFDKKPSKDEAWNLLFGLATDTGFFRHLGSGSAEAFAITAELVDAGISPNDIYMKMFGCRTLESRLLLGKLLDRTRYYYDKKLLITYQTLEDNKQFGKANKDSDMLYMLLQGVKETETVVFVREEDEGVCSVGLRSNSDINVGKVAYAHNGGGHPKAAGFTYKGMREEITGILIDQFSSLF